MYNRVQMFWKFWKKTAIILIVANTVLHSIQPYFLHMQNIIAMHVVLANVNVWSLY